MCSIRLQRKYSLTKTAARVNSPRAFSLTRKSGKTRVSERFATRPYLDEDVAFFLGLLIAGGHFRGFGRFTRLTILIPTRKGRTPSSARLVSQSTLPLSLIDLRGRIEQLVACEPRVSRGDNGARIEIWLTTEGMALKNLLLLCQRTGPRLRWELHPSLLRAPKRICRSFLLGLANGSCLPTPLPPKSDLRLRFRNARLAEQTRQLLEVSLGILTPKARNVSRYDGALLETRGRILRIAKRVWTRLS